MPPVTDPNLLRQLNSAASAPAPAAPMGGDVIVRRADPYKGEDQQFQRNAEARAQQDQSLQIQANARAEAADLRSQAAEARAAQKDVQGTVEQGKSAGFLLRALGANDAYEAQDIGARTLVGESLSKNFPSILNSLPESVGNSPRRQVSDANQDEFIAATLRYESGAAIPPAEIEAQRRRYFPMPGDGEEVLKAKARLRANAIDALKQSSGPLADPTYQRFLGSERTGQAGDSEGLFGTVTDDRPETRTDGGPTPPAPGSGPSGGSPLSGPDAPRSLFGSTLEEIDARDTGLLGLARRGLTAGLSDEAAGLGGFIGGLFTGENPVEAYRRENSRIDRGLEQTRRDSPILGNALEFLGGAASGGPAAAQGINSIAQAARVGAGLGALGGFGYGEGAQGSAVNALGGAALGGVLGGGLQAASGALATRAANRAAAQPQPDMALVQAGERQGIPVRQPDAIPELRGRYAAAESTTYGGPAIREARAADAEAIGNRVAEVGGTGTASDPYALGSRVQEAGRRYIANTRQQANRLYDRARQLAGGRTVTARNADAVLDTNIRELQAAGENSNAAAIRYLQGLRDDIDTGLTLESVQNLRTNMRGQIGEQGLTGTDTERRVGQVLDAMNRDLTEQLPQGASQALRAADDFYRERQQFITGTLQQFMGSRGAPLQAEAAAGRLISMAQGKGNYERFAGMWRQLEPAEQADAAATIAQSLGRSRNGEFSPALLVTSLDPRNGVNPRTARLIFGDDGAQALQDLRTIAAAKRDSMGRQSPSGQAIAGAAGGVKNLVLGAFGFSTGGAMGGVALPVAANFIGRLGEQRAARLLLNPDFTRWLRQAPNSTNPRVIDQYFGRLGAIGSVSANDNQAFTSALRGAFEQSPGRAAAQDEPPGRSEPPRR